MANDDLDRRADPKQAAPEQSPPTAPPGCVDPFGGTATDLPDDDQWSAHPFTGEMVNVTRVNREFAERCRKTAAKAPKMDAEAIKQHRLDRAARLREHEAEANKQHRLDQTVAELRAWDSAGRPPGPLRLVKPTESMPVATPMRSKLLSVTDLGKLPPVRPLVDGFLYAGTLAQISGPPGQYKSFWTIGLACSVASGRSFEGHAVKRGKVVYVAAEGATGARARILAWCELSRIDPADLDGWLYLMPEPIQLGPPASTVELADLATELAVSLVIFDTRARCTLGLVENSSDDQGIAIDNAETIIRRSGATVLAVHHSGREGAHGRGSTAWDGAVWSDLRMSGEELRATVKCAKHKDVPDGCEHFFRLVPHTVSEDLMPGCDESARSTLVTVQNGVWTPPLDSGRNAQIVQKILWTLCPAEGLTPTQLRGLAEDAGASRSGAYEAINVLVRSGFVVNVSETKTPRYVTRTPQPATTSDPLR